MRTDIINCRKEIEFWISQKMSKAYICRELRCRPETLDSYLKKFGLRYQGNKSGEGKRSPVRKNASEYLFNGSTINPYKLKLKLIADNVKRKMCENCEGKICLGIEIPLELHHINGNRFDNRIENLQILCPNCHALTENYSGRKTKKDN